MQKKRKSKQTKQEMKWKTFLRGFFLYAFLPFGM